ncbi:2-C-methyl-D-erythritol 4-phosphate cytidylyltransferase [Marininema halotolerans]|uniref:2-C-methyl-D-erythritol 4-phosphate cytidylyltransferase n=1 Tax=Marininema halotolerans TaxID=1155944 RepID=A0A1I6T7Z9_9BACL|nr:2-C-methyl-D-erythritol 4-phosphate cytidylyltransferase [Marininema halotolerans]SFS85352.1 2-C-methyl-D-erythritol 4-phosphate cytidylyltransferase [Marininema halotolerans]
MGVGVVIPAAGIGKRMGTKVSKQFLEIAGAPVFIHTLRVFEGHPAITEIVIAVREEEREVVEGLLHQYQMESPSIRLVQGGGERQSSVYQGLKAIDAEWVLVHDAVRPFVTRAQVDQLLVAAKETGAAILAVPVKDTVKKVSDAGTVESTLDRNQLWAVQTPQAFSKELLLKAHQKGIETGIEATDDARLVEEMGVLVRVIHGDYVNLKLTTPEDLVLAEAIWNMRCSTHD